MDNTIYFPINKRPDIEKITKFSDKYFPNNITSLFNENNPLRKYKAEKPNKNDFKDDPEGYEDAQTKYEAYLNYLKEFNEDKDEMEKMISSGKLMWKRVSDIITEEIDEERKKYPIKQNYLGDCYLIAFLRRYKVFQPEKYYSLIRYYDFSKGYYEVNFFDENGNNIVVYIDDFIIAKPDGTPFYASIQGENSFIVCRYLLIEKAFAKMNGSYFNINGGYQGIDACYSLSGVYPIYLEKDFFSLDEENIYNIINIILETKNLVLSGTKEEVTFNGIVGNHMYSVLSCYEYDEKSNIKIIKLDNPWGENSEEYIETFSLDLPEKYKNIEDNLKQYYSDNVKNGKIKILIKNFKEQFYILQICMFNIISSEKKNIEKNFGGKFPWGTPPPDRLNMKGFSQRKGILDILGVSAQNQRKFFEKYYNIDIGLSELNDMFIKYGTNIEAFNKLMGISGFFSWVNQINPFNSLNFFK